MKGTVYIAGKVKNLPAEEVENKFKYASAAVEINGYTAINPQKIIADVNKQRVFEGLPILTDEDPVHRQHILRICINHLSTCKHILLLPDWLNSEGARFEKMVADKIGITEVEFINKIL